MVFGSVLAIVGIFLFAFFTWFKGEDSRPNRIQVLHIEFDISHPALVIFLVGCGLIVLPFLLPQPDLDPRVINPALGQTPVAVATLSPTATSMPDRSYTPTPSPEPQSGTVVAAQDVTTAGATVPWELVVEPPVARNYTGLEHKVFITLRDLNGFPIAGERVHFEIAEGPHAGLTLELETDENGQGVFSYTGEGVGTDLIRIWVGADSFEEAPRGGGGEVTHNWL
jgi:hypothetical protein